MKTKEVVCSILSTRIVNMGPCSIKIELPFDEAAKIHRNWDEKNLSNFKLRYDEKEKEVTITASELEKIFDESNTKHQFMQQVFR